MLSANNYQSCSDSEQRVRQSKPWLGYVTSSELALVTFKANDNINVFLHIGPPVHFFPSDKFIKNRSAVVLNMACHNNPNPRPPDVIGAYFASQPYNRNGARKASGPSIRGRRSRGGNTRDRCQIRFLLGGNGPSVDLHERAWCWTHSWRICRPEAAAASCSCVSGSVGSPAARWLTDVRCSAAVWNDQRVRRWCDPTVQNIFSCSSGRGK